MKNRPFLSLAILSSLIIIHACVDHDLGNYGVQFNVDCTGLSEISYSASVNPIIETKCAITGCHNDSNSSLPNWTELSNLQAKKAEIQRRITLPLNHPDKMPRTGSISDAERQVIFCWIEQGAQNN